jgi:Conserved TM helix
VVDWQTTVIQPMEQMWTNVLGFLPTLVSVLLILLIGWMLAALAQKAITRFLKLARLDSVSEKIGISNILTKGDINYTLSEIIGVMVYWLLMLVVFLMAVNALQLTVAAELLNQVILYVPNVIASVFILVLGIFFASIIANTVRTTAANAGIQQARTLGQFTQVIIVVFTIIESLNQLKIDTSIIELVIKATLAAIALGVGLAIGLGCKDMAGRYVGQFLDSFKSSKK